MSRKIFITGGAGFLGRGVIDKYYNTGSQITVFSRDECKHYYLSKTYPNVRFIIGDVRNQDLLNRSCRGHDVGIFAASLKQIDACSQNVEEAVQTIVHGAINSKRAAIENNLESACFISTDKSRAATTIYGSLKYIAGESFILNNDNISTRLSTAIYGNVTNSTGSLIPLIWESIRGGYTMILYEETMTRFMIDIEEAIDTIEKCLLMKNVNVVPNVKSFRVKDVFEIYKEQFGLKYTIGVPRVNEKIHEIMSSSEEVPRMKYLPEKDCYIIDPHKVYNEVKFNNNEYSSKDRVMAKNELYLRLSKKNFYQ
tara:strand:- start:344 stop:1276 length:933 start_codon:yes stop_codon:yes gene_type:complete